LHSHVSTDFNKETHVGLAKLSTSISLRPRIFQFKMESIFKMALLRLSICPSEPFIFPIFKSTIFKFWFLIEDYIKFDNDTFGFFDSLSIISEIELGLRPYQIIFLIIFHHFLWIFPIPLKLRVDPIIYFGSSNHLKKSKTNWSK
jgi:hypothetical protein